MFHPAQMAEGPRPDAFVYARSTVHTDVDHVQEKAGVGGKHHSSQVRRLMSILLFGNTEFCRVQAQMHLQLNLELLVPSLCHTDQGRHLKRLACVSDSSGLSIMCTWPLRQAARHMFCISEACKVDCCVLTSPCCVFQRWALPDVTYHVTAGTPCSYVPSP